MTTDEIIEQPYTCNGGGGCSGTTPVWIKKTSDGFEARCGFALMGSTNMSDAEFEACGYNPFSPKFQDNYAIGKGATEQDALDSLKEDMKSIGDSLWAF